MTSGQPSTAHYEQNRYVHCPINQPLAEAEAKGLTGARDIADHKHITSIQGYCKHGVLGGCPKDGE